ncbi:DUF6651 domain-containing protein [Moellerella wisconsensis]|uniref:DUF6651 domain-containing protein n=2 Tax=Moellerella wisconsensis TaxID=158849 RepID=UPI001F4E2C39|nr:DUF6651 domain-containing protein [Moellerella wisconsensis]
MNLFQMLMARRGLLMDIETGGDGSGGAGDPPQPEKSPEARNDGYSSLSQEEMLARLVAADAEKATLIKETMKRKADNKTLTEKLTAFGDATPEQISELLESKRLAEEESQRREQEEQEKRGEFDAVKKQMVEAHKVEVQSRDEKLQAVETENQSLRAQILEMTVGTAFGGSNFLREETLITPAKARVIYGAHFEVNEEGKVVGFDKPAGSKDRAVLVDGSGNALDFEQAIERVLKSDPEVDSLLRSKAKQGAGSKSEPQPTQQAKGRELDSLGKISVGLSKLHAKK